MHAVEGRDEGVLVNPNFIALPQQHPHISAVLSLWQEPTIELAGKHLWIVLQDCSSKTDRVSYKIDLFLVLWIFNQVDGILKISKDLMQRKSRHLGIEPAIVEEDVIIEVLVPVATDKLER